MHWYTIQETLTHTDHPPQPETPAVVLLTSEELDHHPTLPGLETVLLHTPSAQDAKVCKADVRWDCLSGTLVLPRQEKDEGRTTYGYLIAQNRVALVDDGDTVPGLLRHIAREKRPMKGSVGRFVYAFFNQPHRSRPAPPGGDRGPRPGAGGSGAEQPAQGVHRPHDRPAEGDHGLVPLLLPTGRRGL